MATAYVQLGGGAQPAVTVKITEVAAGEFRFEVTQSGAVIGDLRGLFFDVARESLVSGAGTQAAVSALQAKTQAGAVIGSITTAAVADGDDSVTGVGGGDNTMNGALAFNGVAQEAKGYDVGLEFGTSGIGKDDVGAVAFTLKLSGMTLADVAGQDFGVRMTSVGLLGGDRGASVKLTGSAFVAVEDANDTIQGGAQEDTVATGDVLQDTVATLGGGRMTETLTWASLDGGATRLAFGQACALGSTGATIVLNADGTYSIDASGADALSAIQSVPFVVTYGVAQTYFDAAGHKVGQLAETSTLSFDIKGVNDAPVVSGVVIGAAVEDGDVSSLNALANASDVDDGDVLSVVGVPAVLPAGVSYDAAAKTFVLNPAAYQGLAEGQTAVVTVNYGVSDGIAVTPGQVQWTVTGVNDAPVVTGAVTGLATEDAAVSPLNALANASDVDAGAVLTVTDLPAALPAGVSYDAAAQAFVLNPGDAAYQSLGHGETTTVVVTYGVSDGFVTTPASVQWTLTGANDAPIVTGAVTGLATEDGAKVTLNALQNAWDVDAKDVLVVVSPQDLPAGVTFDAATQSFTLDPAHAAFQTLNAGQSTVVTVSYGVFDGVATTPATVQWTVAGVNEPAATPVTPVTPVPPTPPTADNFPLAPKDLSHVTFYFDLTPQDQTDQAFFFAKVETPGAVNDDLDSWYHQAVDRIVALNPNLAQAELVGAAIKYGSPQSGGGEFYYGLDGDLDQDAVPTGHLIQGSEYKLYAGGVTYGYDSLF
ncbi:VCBS domain-containing protein [Phenylobacterium sp. VNQ135]|uniref:VCBS domain-containing protein n=1 Tax=Phenylobacterium sp. VNQ135 TaxID=3400922 RepID=UPI003C0E1122